LLKGFSFCENSRLSFLKPRKNLSLSLIPIDYADVLFSNLNGVVDANPFRIGVNCARNVANAMEREKISVLFPRRRAVRMVFRETEKMYVGGERRMEVWAGWGPVARQRYMC